MRRENRQETKEIIAAIIVLAWPTMLEEELRTVVQYVDAAMVGRLGADASATVGITTMVTWLINSPLGAAGIGVMAYISRSVGAGETEKVKRAFIQAIFMDIVLVVLEKGIALGASGSMPCISMFY